MTPSIAVQTPTLTAHAAIRCTQRSIAPHGIDLFLDYGARARVRGADSYFFDKAARRRLREDLGADGVRGVERWLDAYVVVGDDGRVITAAWRTRRLRRR